MLLLFYACKSEIKPQTADFEAEFKCRQMQKLQISVLVSTRLAKTPKCLPFWTCQPVNAASNIYRI